jgi:hypothetical protein
MSDIKSGSIEFRDYPPLESDKEYKFEVLSSGQVIATAYVNDYQGKFWHLDGLLVHQKKDRYQGYGSKLLNHLRDYLWSTSVESCNKTLQSLRFTQVKSIVY